MSCFPKRYNPKDFEEKLYKNWESSGKFKPRESTTGDNFYIPMPPPNVTSKLHIGHSSMLTLEDIMVRYHRMKGDSSLLLPGTDHAGIATQIKVEEKLAKEGKSKHNMSREDFLEECFAWNDKHGSEIQNQFRKMGTSCDWTKEKFTLDPSMNKVVNKAFVDLYNKDLIYKGEYMVNYDPVLKTVVSDQEVIYREEKTKLYHITYFVSGSDNEIIIATTRPETLLGDVAVAVHPKDKRYKKLIKAGKKLILPIVNKEIPIIADEMVDMEFGTGAVKITPAHDQNDFEVAKRHDLPLDNIVISKDGKMTNGCGIFSGQDFMTARSNIVELLKSKGNLIGEEDHISRVGYGERSNAKIETIISTQWFVKVQPIIKKVIKGYKAKEFEIIPKRYNKTFEDWAFNLRDWCISRQLIWGHQIPVWYGPDESVFCCETEEEAMKQAKDKFGEHVELTRDPDALDTWFSSGLWPFAVFDYDIGGDKQSDLFKQFYPASVLETGHDIIFFWVIRMLMFGYEFTDMAPFKTIYLHGLVKDKTGRKMSKSLGNGTDPLEIIDKYGTDALRLTLSIGNTPGNDLKFDEANVENNMFFINKLWNASRFVFSNIGEFKGVTHPPRTSGTKLTPATARVSLMSKGRFNIGEIEKVLVENYDDLMFHEKWILSRIKYLSDLVTEGMEKYSFSEVGLELQAFTKNEFCDYYIEEFKLTKETSKYGESVIIYVLNNLLKLWHPYIPFVTSEIYNKLGFPGELMESEWSKVNIPRDEEIEKEKKLIIDVIREIRNLRAENKIMPNKTIGLQIYAKNKNLEIITKVIDLIGGIVKAESLELISKKPSDPNLAFGIIKAGVEVYIDTANCLDIEKEILRIKDQILDTKEYVALLDKKLLNSGFVDKAPAHLVRAEMEKKKSVQDKLEKLEDKLEKLKI